MNFLTAIFIIVLMVFDASAKKFSDNDLTIGDKTTSAKTITLGKSGQNIIRVPSGGGNLEISNDGGSGFNEISAGQQPNEPDTVSNGAILTSVATSALTVALKQSDASTDATASDPVRVSMRVTPLTSGAYNSRTVTSSLSLVVPSGATLNHFDGVDGFIYVYVLDFSATIELAVSSARKDESILQTTIALSAGSDADALYSTTLRSNVPIRLIARLKSNQVTAGTWALNMSEISPGDDLTDLLNIKINGIPDATNNKFRITSVRISNSGTPTIAEDFSGSGTSWIASLVDNGIGDTTVNFRTNVFDGATAVICPCSGSSSTIICNSIPSTASVNITTFDSAGAANDANFIMNCFGFKGSL